MPSLSEAYLPLGLSLIGAETRNTMKESMEPTCLDAATDEVSTVHRSGCVSGSTNRAKLAVEV